MHFTHVDNLPGILAAGLRADAGVRDERGSLLVTEAADLDIKARRRAIPVPVPPYGYVADYVPFYFAPRSPMLYKLFKGSVPGYADGQDPLIYLVTTVESLSAAGSRSLFSDGNCAKAITVIYDDLDQLDAVIDWPVMRARMWNDTADDPDRMRRRMAEFIVHERVPVDCLTGIAVRTEPMRDRVERVLAAHGADLPVRVRQDWYF
jgi:hypothetical protein